MGEHNCIVIIIGGRLGALAAGLRIRRVFFFVSSALQFAIENVSFICLSVLFVLTETTTTTTTPDNYGMYIHSSILSLFSVYYAPPQIGDTFV